MLHYNAPLDPDCPAVRKMCEPDPMDQVCGCMDEIYASAERRHRRSCERCQQYGAGNIEVADV